MSGRIPWLADVLADAFRGYRGFRVDVVPGWESRGRAVLYPVGTMNHHTGGGTYNALLSYMAHNSSIAPLCNWATSRPVDGVVRITVVASGKANHAGRGYYPWIGHDRGNPRTVGGEHQNTGAQSWPDQQNEAIFRGNAAILGQLGQPSSRAIDHKTYAPGRKVDRVHIDVAAWQRVLAAYMAGDDMIATRGGANDEAVVKRIQSDCNQILTFRAFGPEGMSIQPKGDVGTAVDGDYGPNTATAVREAVKAAIGATVSGESFGATEAYALLRIGYWADDARHTALHPHGEGGGSGGAVDLSGLATDAELRKVDKRVSAVDGKVTELGGRFDRHRHDEGRTGGPQT